jgi:hypothetical protein
MLEHRTYLLYLLKSTHLKVLLFSVALQSSAGYDLLVHEVS